MADITVVAAALAAAWKAVESLETGQSFREQRHAAGFDKRVVKEARRALENHGGVEGRAAARLLGDPTFTAFAADPDDPARLRALSDRVKVGEGLKGLIGPGADEAELFAVLARAWVAAALMDAKPVEALLAAKQNVTNDTLLAIIDLALDAHTKHDAAAAEIGEVLARLRVEVTDLLVGEPFLAQDVDRTAFQMASNVTSGLVPPYVPRDIDPQLDELLADAAIGGSRFIAVAGRTKSGKTRCLLEALARVTPLHLVYRVRHSKQRDTISTLIDALAAEPPGQPWVILVDDLYQHLAGGVSADLTPAARRVAQIEPPGLIVATTATETMTLAKAQRVADGINDDDLQLIDTRHVTLPPATTPAEQARASSTLGPRLAEGEIGPGDLARFPERLAAIPELLGRIDHARHQLPSSSSRYALIVAATRIALSQANRAVSRAEVRDHARCIHTHLEAHERGALALGDHVLDQAEAWASERVGAAYALLVPTQGADDTVEVLDAALSHLGSVAIDPRFGPCGPTDSHYATRLGTIAFFRFNNLTAGIYWTSQAADAGDNMAMFIHGLLLKEQGDSTGAEAQFQRAAELDNTLAMMHLGDLLKERGDRAGALKWYRRLAGPGHGAEMRNSLGVKCKERGDLAGAETEWQRAAELGHAGASYSLGVLREERGDLAGAADWYRRAAASEDATVAAAAVDSLARFDMPRDEDAPEA